MPKKQNQKKSSPVMPKPAGGVARLPAFCPPGSSRLMIYVHALTQLGRSCAYISKVMPTLLSDAKGKPVAPSLEQVQSILAKLEKLALAEVPAGAAADAQEAA